MEAGFLLNVRRKSNQEPACMGFCLSGPLDEHRRFHLPYHTGGRAPETGSHAHLARVLRLWLLWKICMITCGVV